MPSTLATRDSPAAGSPSGTGGPRAVLRRVARRRSMRLLGVLALAVWVLLFIGDLHTYETPSHQDVAAARAEIAAEAADRAECLADPDPPPTDLPAAWRCGDPPSRDLRPYLDDHPFVLASEVRDASAWGALVSGPVALAAGLGWLGRRTSTRQPGAEVIALVGAAAAFTLLGQLLALCRVALLVWLAGPHPEVPDPGGAPEALWGAVLGTQPRIVWLTVTAALCGLGLAWLLRGRVAVLAVVLVGWLVIDVGFSEVVPATAPWAPWAPCMPLFNVVSLLLEDGTFLPDPDIPEGPAGTTNGFVVSHVQAGVYFGVLSAVLLVAGLLRNARDGRAVR